MDPKIAKLDADYREIEAKLAAGTLSPAELKELSRRHSALAASAAKARELARLEKELADLKSLAGDPEMRAMAEEERPRLESRLSELQAEILLDLLPKDPADVRNAFIEIRAGAGGEESALFAAELLRMYTRFAESKGWKVEVHELSQTGLKGLKQAVIFVTGKDVYSWLRHEGGVHRVQRVPATEAAGRIHTSTVTVAVMPEVEEAGEIEVKPD